MKAAIFWEAPERVIDYLLGVVSGVYALKCSDFLGLLLLPKCSDAFYGKMLACLEQRCSGGKDWKDAMGVRPHLAAKLRLPGRR